MTLQLKRAIPAAIATGATVLAVFGAAPAEAKPAPPSVTIDNCTVTTSYVPTSPATSVEISGTYSGIRSGAIDSIEAGIGFYAPISVGFVNVGIITVAPILWTAGDRTSGTFTFSDTNLIIADPGFSSEGRTLADTAYIEVNLGVFYGRKDAGKSMLCTWVHPA